MKVTGISGTGAQIVYYKGNNNTESANAVQASSGNTPVYIRTGTVIFVWGENGDTGAISESTNAVELTVVQSGIDRNNAISSCTVGDDALVFTQA